MATDRIQFSEETVFIIGAGHFGARAARIICQRSNSPIYVVDPDEKRLQQLSGPQIEKVTGDGIRFLVDNFHALKPNSTIVPALPVHLAYEWLIAFLRERIAMRRLRMPHMDPPLPHAWPAGEGSLLVSYADFLCPDDCPEPAHCTVTGKKRERPLYALLRDLQVPLFHVYIIRSHQLAPGLGGYPVQALKQAAETLLLDEVPKWILGTACKCHGILTAFETSRTSSGEDTGHVCHR